MAQELNYMKGTEGAFDYVVFAKSKDDKVLLGIKPLITVYPQKGTTTKFAARVRAMANDKATPPVIGADGGTLFVNTFEKAQFTKADNTRASFVLTSDETLPDSYTEMVTETVSELFKIVSDRFSDNWAPTDIEGAKEYVLKHYLKRIKEVNGPSKEELVTGSTASVSTIGFADSSASEPDDKTDDKPDDKAEQPQAETKADDVKTEPTLEAKPEQEPVEGKVDTTPNPKPESETATDTPSTP